MEGSLSAPSRRKSASPRMQATKPAPLCTPTASSGPCSGARPSWQRQRPWLWRKAVQRAASPVAGEAKVPLVQRAAHSAAEQTLPTVLSSSRLTR